MNSEELAKHIEQTDSIGKSWLLVQLRLQKLAEAKSDLSPEEYERALELTREAWRNKNKEGEPAYPGGEIVRNQTRSPQNPLLLIYFLEPQGAGLPNDSEPIVGYAISFPGSRFNASVSYAVHRQLLPLFNQEDDLEDVENDDED